MIDRSRQKIDELAKALRDAEQSATTIDPIRKAIGEEDVETAYAISQTNQRARANAGGRLMGRKIGLTSVEVQEQIGVDEPDFGALFADMAYGHGESVPYSRLIAPRVEGEMALILSRDIDTDQPTFADILLTTEYVVASIEVVDSRVHSLGDHVHNLTGEWLTPEGLEKIAAIDAGSLPQITPERLGAPVGRPGKIIAIGLSYTDHAKEANLPIPSEPVVFSKAVTCLSVPNDDVVLPKDAKKGDWEVELAMVIGSPARHVSQSDALSLVAGYAVANDVSEREWQAERGGSWDKGKGFDTFLPLGPWLVTADSVADPQALGLWLDVNGERRQSGSTSTMIFSCAEIIEYLSCCMTLVPGDVIITGTPPGVGMGVKPEPIYLKDGDVMALGIDELGEQEQKVHGFDLKKLPPLESYLREVGA